LGLTVGVNEIKLECVLLVRGLPWDMERRGNCQVGMYGWKLGDSDLVPAAACHVELALHRFSMIGHQEARQSHRRTVSSIM
jgi:hypothetical protein